MGKLWYMWLLAHLWIVELVGALFIFFILNILFKYLLNFSKRHLAPGNVWRSHLEQVVSLPTRCLLWIFLFTYLFHFAARYFQSHETIFFLIALCKGGIVVCVAWLILRWKKTFQQTFFSRPHGIDQASLEILGKLLTVIVFFISCLLILQLFGLNILPLVTFGGIGAAILGIASKDVVANFFGGLMVYLTRPFHRGDLIELPLNHISGHIEQIGWYFTSIRDLQKKPIYIPNSVFSTGIVVNLSRMTHRRIEEKLSIRFADFSKASQVVEGLQRFLSEYEKIDRQLPIYVYVVAYGTFSIDLEIKAYIKGVRYDQFMQAKQVILLEAYRILREMEVDIPFPTTEIIVNTPPPTRMPN